MTCRFVEASSADSISSMEVARSDWTSDAAGARAGAPAPAPDGDCEPTERTCRRGRGGDRRAPVASRSGGVVAGGGPSPGDGGAQAAVPLRQRLRVGGALEAGWGGPGSAKATTAGARSSGTRPARSCWRGCWRASRRRVGTTPPAGRCRSWARNWPAPGLQSGSGPSAVSGGGWATAGSGRTTCAGDPIPTMPKTRGGACPRDGDGGARWGGLSRRRDGQARVPAAARGVAQTGGADARGDQGTQHTPHHPGRSP
jgi:hypothetical protein